LKKEEKMQMQLQSKVKSLIVERGYNSLADFADQEKVSYHMLRRLAYNRGQSIETRFLVELCEKLDCQISDLLVVKERSGKGDE
jgi:DNA-binding Xre family transcriptional regulator